MKSYEEDLMVALQSARRVQKAALKVGHPRLDHRVERRLL